MAEAEKVLGQYWLEVDLDFGDQGHSLKNVPGCVF